MIRGTRDPGPMDVYLPIAELSLNVFVLLGLGAGDRHRDRACSGSAAAF